MPADIRTRILKVQEKSGFIPNVFLMLAYRPDEFRAFMAYHDALMDKEGGLTKAEREMIVVVIPTRADHHALAQSRRPMDMMIQGWSMRRFHAEQQWSTMSA